MRQEQAAQSASGINAFGRSSHSLLPDQLSEAVETFDTINEARE